VPDGSLVKPLGATAPFFSRRIRYRDEANRRELVFLTNHLELPATIVAAIYKERCAPSSQPMQIANWNQRVTWRGPKLGGIGQFCPLCSVNGFGTTAALAPSERPFWRGSSARYGAFGPRQFTVCAIDPELPSKFGGVAGT